jgi:cytochrome c oxidase subunit 2
MRVRHALFVAAVLALGATGAAAQGTVPLAPGPHDALAATGPQAAHIGALWNLFLALCTAVFAAILIACGWALWRTPRAAVDTPPDLAHVDRHEPGPYRSVALATGVSALLLLFLIVASVWTDRALARLPLEQAINLRVTGHQWWWEIRYEGSPESQTFTTANELHVPVGRPVVIQLNSDDVIHSLWVPNLSGKKDLIPGRTATLSFRADRPGIYRGQCAEFCGYQHAFMAFEVIAEAPEHYEAWAEQQRREASEPSDPRGKRGKEVFLGSTCVMCHTIQGTDANAIRGPDLTHVGGRTTLASGTLPNTDEDMKRWIRNPQQLKPGVNMPTSSLAEADLDALVTYLRGLK